MIEKNCIFYRYSTIFQTRYTIYLKFAGSVNTKQRNRTVVFSTVMRVDFNFNVFSKSGRHFQIERLYGPLILCSVSACTGPITCRHSVTEPNWEITRRWREQFKICKLNLNFNANNYFSSLSISKSFQLNYNILNTL